MANKTKYGEWLTPEGLAMIEEWARIGLIEDQIAKNMGISRSTLSEWKKTKSDISDALKRGKAVADYEVESALFKRALGFRYVEVTKESGVVTKEVTKEVAPDTTAAIFWLKNRKPSEWRDKQELNLQGDLGIRVEVDYGEDD